MTNETTLTTANKTFRLELTVPDTGLLTLPTMNIDERSLYIHFNCR